MIKITAKVKIYEESDGEIANEDVSAVSGNNASASISYVVNSMNTQTRNVFMIADASGNGGSALDGSAVYADTTESFYISSSTSGYNGVFATPIDIDIAVGDDQKLPNQINILFDASYGGYATIFDLLQDGAVIDTITNDKTLLTISGYDQTKVLAIRIKSINKAYSHLIITAIYANLYFDIDESRMVSCEFELNEKADPTLPSFGVISNDGSIEFKDYDGSFLQLIEEGRLNDRKQVVFQLENTYDRTKADISQFLTEKVEYDDDTNTVNIDVVDRLVEWQDVKDVRVYLERDKTMLYVYNKLVELTPNKKTTSNPIGYEFAELSSDIQDYLSHMSLDYFYLDNDNLWAQWRKFCEATGLYIYINKSNQIFLAGEFDFLSEA